MKSDRRLRYLQAINEALRQCMVDDGSVFVIGEDIRGALRGETRGLHSEFGDLRVIDTPVSEAAFVGFATGAALEGLRPVVEFQVSSLIYVAFDQLANQAVKYRYMLGGQASLPVTYLVMAAGAANGLAGQHSDNPYPFFLHAGMKVVCPSTPFDAKGLLVSAIEDNDPVAFFAPTGCLTTRGEVPEDRYSIPLGQGLLRRDGTDLTVVATGHLVNEAVEISDRLRETGVSVAVWDPRTLLPLDSAGLQEAVARTKRLVVFDDSNRTCGFGAELIAAVVEEQGDSLLSKPTRVTRGDVPIPFSPPLEAAALPDARKLERAIISQLEGAS